MQAGNVRLQLLELRRLELDHLTATSAHQVLVMRTCRTRLIATEPFPKVMLSDEPGLQQQVERSVYRCLSDRVPANPQPLDDLVRRYVVMGPEQDLGDP